MAGSLARFAYISDDGTTYSIRMDNSNGLAVGNTLNAVAADLPRTYRPRYVLATDTSDGSHRKLVIGDPANPLFVGPEAGTVSIADFDTDPNATTAHSVRSRIGERRYAR
jgi:hypothetical protein